MTNLNLIFDFQNIAMRALYTCGYGIPTVSSFDTDEECAILVRKITTDITYVIRMFSPGRVIIAADARHPWRKDLYTSADETYKGNRVKDETKNWDKIFASFDELKKIYADKGFIVSELPHAEADDIASLWKAGLFNESADKENIMFVTSDRDWLQLLDFKDDNRLAAAFNPIPGGKGRRILSVTHACRDWIFSEDEKPDIFFSNYSPIKELLKNIQRQDEKITYTAIEPESIVLEKVMCGDDGDNVPSFYQYYKNGRKMRITPLKANKLFEDLNISTIEDLCMAESANALKPALEKLFKKDIDDIDTAQRLDLQRHLVELDPALFPEDIVKSFKYHFKDMMQRPMLSTLNMTMQDILKDTRYITKDYNKPKKNSVFDGLDIDDIKGREKFVPDKMNQGSVF